MSFTPSSFIKHIFRRDISEDNDTATNTITEDTRNYYEKISVSQDATVPAEVRRAADLPARDMHFFLTHRSKILQIRELEQDLGGKKTIVIRHNTDLTQDHPHRVLERLLRQLERKYPRTKGNVVYGGERNYS
jgi:hypothetical protein